MLPSDVHAGAFWLLRKALGDLLRYLHAGADGKLKVYAESAIIGGGEELCAHLLHQEDRANECGDADGDCGPAMAHNPCHERGVSIVECVEALVDGGKEYVVELAVLGIA